MTNFNLDFHGLKGYWTISESRGEIIAFGVTKQEAIDKLKQFMDKKEAEDEEKFKLKNNLESMVIK